MMMTTTSVWITSLFLATGNGGEGDKKKKATNAPPKVTIKLRADAVARGTSLRISDVAAVTSTDPQLTQRILALDIGRPPQPGYTRTIARNDIMIRVMREGFPQRGVQFEGGTQAFVQPATHHLAPREITTAAERVLDRAILQSAQPDITYKLRSRLTGMRVPVGRSSRELIARVKDGRLGHNHAQISVDVMVDGELYKSIPIYYGLKRFYKVLSLAYGIMPGTVLSESNLTWKRIESLHGVDQYVTNFEQVRGMSARTRLRRGTLLTHHHIGVRSLIRAGDIVELVLRSGLVKVRTKVRAMDDGHLGKFIRVVRLRGIGKARRQVDANAILVAKVASTSTVVIDSGPK